MPPVSNTNSAWAQHMVSTHRGLTDEDIRKIADTYHAWRGDKDAGEYRDVPGFCKSATLVNATRPYCSVTDIAARGEYAPLPVDALGGEA